jgi:hypothetical protein
MNRIEQELFDLEEHLRRNDDIADNSAYLTIIGIANKVSELDAENTKLRELVRGLHIAHVGMTNRYKGSETGLIWEYSGDTENDTRKLESECEEECHRFDTAMRELGVEVD